MYKKEHHLINFISRSKNLKPEKYKLCMKLILSQ
jgi:hypothetical protein